MKFLVEGQIVLLAGDAGIGKSRLVTASKAAATGTGYQILESSCFEPDRTVPCAPLIELLRTLRVELPELTPPRMCMTLSRSGSTCSARWSNC
jgi:predicted ATPase